ncbi:MAG: efflux RND transporter periplasmic adaptor subunit [Nitrospiraceae bacterium]|nr:efflux RND transporter periplasmic adaptor subunit [Nitrospiraceae bacterium]
MAKPNSSKVGRTIFGWLAAVAAAAALVYYLVAMREDVIEVTAMTLERGRVEQTVSAISAGTVKPRMESMVAASYVGKVLRVPFKEGDAVKKGDVLVELEHAELDAQVALAEANLRVGLSRLEQAKMAAAIYADIAQTRVSQTNAQLKTAQLDYDRVQALSQEKAISDSDFDKVALLLQVARETNAAALASQRETEVRQEEIRSAEAAIEQLEAAVTLAKETREKAYVRAPFDGVVAKVFVDVGEAVGTGLGIAGTAGLTAGSVPSSALVQLLQNSEFYVEAPFDEANASQVMPGQTARIELDAYRDTYFSGTVEFISPIVSLNMDLSRTLDIDVRIEEGQEKFVAGMSADVILVSAAKDDVLYIPSEALIRGETAYVVENGRATRRTVEAGIGNWRTQEVLSGLSEGEQLITSVTIKDLKEGVKVRVVESLD